MIDLDALRRGDPAASATLYREHGRDVLRWVIRLGGPHLDPEDVAQDVFIVALRTVGRFRGDSSLRTWLFGVTRRVVANARRKAALRRFVGLDQVAEPVHHGPSAEHEVGRLQARRRIQGALERLSTKQREVLVLADLEGHSAPEVGQLLGIPTNTVYSRLHAGRKAFAKALEAEGLGPDGLLPGEADGTVVPLRRRS